MSTCCGGGPSRYSPEYTKQFKPESNGGCCCGSSNDCTTPSRAKEGSPLWKWEQIHGKLYTVFTTVSDANGQTHTEIERVTCPLTTTKPRRSECCSVKYRVTR